MVECLETDCEKLNYDFGFDKSEQAIIQREKDHIYFQKCVETIKDWTEEKWIKCRNYWHMRDIENLNFALTACPDFLLIVVLFLTHEI